MEHTTLFISYLLLIVLCLSCTLGSDPLTKIAERRTSNPGLGWVYHSEPHPLEPITFKVLLKQRNLDHLEKTFWEVSDPKHANYGKYLQKHEVDSMIAPEPAAVKRVLGWLGTSGVPTESMVVHSDYIEITLPVQHVSQLFQTTFSVYASAKLGQTRTRISEPAHIPTELTNDIDFVVGISELFNDYKFHAVRHPKPTGNASTIALAKPRDANADQPITPAVLASYYGIPAGTTATNKTNSMGITGFNDFFSSGALASSQTNFKLKQTVVAFNGPACTLAKQSTCGQTESDLDVQYSTALGAGVATTFYSHKNSLWVLDWAQQLSALASPPLINSASYGWSENEQCSVTNGCNTYGYVSSQYVARTDTEFQSLGIRGVSILVSSGDDGAPAYYNGAGNCPLDAASYCIKGGCTHTSTACPEITITKAGVTSGACYFPMGVAADQSNCASFLNDANFNTAFTAFVTANPTCGIAIDQDSDGNLHFYTTCACASLKATTSTGYTLAAYVYSPTAAPTFEAMYPASSPYLTSVGATQFGWTGTTPTSEGVASAATGSLITSGGGFSSYQKQPSYQKDAVNSWLSNGVNRPPSGSFNPANRAYPDITMNGHNYVVFASTGDTNMNLCPCTTYAVDGTSCSSPALAGLFSLINDQLLNAGKPPLGFLNPLLYQMARENPAAYKDITAGGIQCNRAYCCKYGYSASAGWDPASGLGAPVFTEMAAYIMTATVGAGEALRAGALSLAVPAALLLLSYLL